MSGMARVNLTWRRMSPCYGCEERHTNEDGTNCHADCERYREYRELCDRDLQAKNDSYVQNKGFYAFMQNSTDRHRRK